MTKEEILQQLYEILVRKSPVFSQYTLEQVRNESLNSFGLDSIGLLNFMVAIEDEIGIEWDEDRTTPETLKSLNNIADHIENEFADIK